MFHPFALFVCAGRCLSPKGSFPPLFFTHAVLKAFLANKRVRICLKVVEHPCSSLFPAGFAHPFFFSLTDSNNSVTSITVGHGVDVATSVASGIADVFTERNKRLERNRT